MGLTRTSSPALPEAAAVVAVGAAIAPELAAGSDEVAATVCYLASPRASYLTGTVHNISGGLVLD